MKHYGFPDDVDMEGLSALQAVCEGIYRSPMDSPRKRSVTWTVYAFAVISLKKPLNK